MSNHLSFLDGPLLMTVLDRPAQVLVVLPYVPDAVKAWVDVLPGQLDKVKEQKHPADPAKLDDKGKQTMERNRGPAGIRLSVQGPGGRERDEVSLRAAGSAFQSVDVRAAIDIAACPEVNCQRG